ncbi:MAG: hypothetical protein U0822_09920 [Anaerolineae bacterium]
MESKELDWAQINDLLRELQDEIEWVRERDEPPWRSPSIELRANTLFRALNYRVGKIARQVVLGFDWVGESGYATPEEKEAILIPECTAYCLEVVERRMREGPRLEGLWPKFIGTMLNRYRIKRNQRARVAQWRTSSIATMWETDEGEIEREIASDEPTPEQLAESGDYHSVSDDVLAALGKVFVADSRGERNQRVHRRRLMILLHCPFLGHSQRYAQELFLTLTDLARLLDEQVPTVTKDRQTLADWFHVNPVDNPREWAEVTAIRVRIEFLAPAVTALLGTPSLFPDYQSPLELLWHLLRLAQPDGREQRQKIWEAQGDDPFVPSRIGDYTVSISVHPMDGFDGMDWIGGRVVVHNIHVTSPQVAQSEEENRP